MRRPRTWQSGRPGGAGAAFAEAPAFAGGGAGASAGGLQAVRRAGGVVRDVAGPRAPRTVGAAVEGAIGVDAVADDPALAVCADRRQPVDGALEAVEDVPLPRGD